MGTPGFTLGAFAFAMLAYSVAGYHNGRVTKSCGDMIPQHGHSPQSEPVHSITLSQMKFRPGDQIEVTLSGPTFKGFLLEARNAEDLSGPPVGSFTLIDREVSQLLTCEDVQGSAVSHTSSSNKTEIKVYWNAPSSAPNHIQFLATVVKRYKSYWVKIPSHVISQPNALPITTPSATIASLSTPPPVSHLSKPFSASECGNKKFCIRSPLNCDPEKEAACVFLSFTRLDQSVMVEMSGPSEGFVSFAFSHDRWMGDDDAYLCIREDQTVHIQPSYLMGRSYPVMESRLFVCWWSDRVPPSAKFSNLGRGNCEILARSKKELWKNNDIAHRPQAWSWRTEAEQGTLEDMAWRLADGVIQCSFRRNVTLPGVKNRFALNASYYMFLADGAAHDGRIFKHSQQPLITYEKYDVTGTPRNIGGSRSSPLLKAHGALMFVAWMTTVSIGVLVARFFRSVWSKAFFLGEAAWFQVHRVLMLTTSALTCIAFVMPFVYRGGWSLHAGYHPYLGCTVMTLAVLQPLLAVFRPHLHDPRRQMFNWTHWSVGTAARIIAVAAMFLGMDLPGLNLPSPQKTYAMMGFVVWHIGTEVLLEIHAYRLSRKVEILDDDRIQILRSLNVVEAEGHVFKKVVLTVYICGNVIFLIIFLSAIKNV